MLASGDWTIPVLMVTFQIWSHSLTHVQVSLHPGQGSFRQDNHTTDFFTACGSIGRSDETMICQVWLT